MCAYVPIRTRIRVFTYISICHYTLVHIFRCLHTRTHPHSPTFIYTHAHTNTQVVDKHVCPDEHRDFYTERLMYMPHSYQANSFKVCMSHHHTYYVTSSYILCHIIIHTSQLFQGMYVYCTYGVCMYSYTYISYSCQAHSAIARTCTHARTYAHTCMHTYTCAGPIQTDSQPKKSGYTRRLPTPRGGP